MTISALLIFAGVYFAAVATPGPRIAALSARMMAHGFVGVVPFVAGYVVGDVIWLFVAWRMVSAGDAAPTGATSRRAISGWRAFMGSLALTLGNPKVMMFFLSIMPLVVDVKSLSGSILIDLALTCALVLSVTLSAYALAANRARALLRSSRAMRFARRAAGGAMASAALAIAAR